MIGKGRCGIYTSEVRADLNCMTKDSIRGNFSPCHILFGGWERGFGALGQAIVGAVQHALKLGFLDKSKRGTVRAVSANAKDFTDDDWWLIVENALGDWDGGDEDEAIRVAAEWARENCGLGFDLLRKGGAVVGGLSSAIEVFSYGKYMTALPGR